MRLSPTQRRLYAACLASQFQPSDPVAGGRGKGLFAMYQQLQQIFNHPRVLRLNADGAGGARRRGGGDG